MQFFNVVDELAEKAHYTLPPKILARSGKTAPAPNAARERHIHTLFFSGQENHTVRWASSTAFIDGQYVDHCKPGETTMWLVHHRRDSLIVAATYGMAGLSPCWTLGVQPTKHPHGFSVIPEGWRVRYESPSHGAQANTLLLAIDCPAGTQVELLHRQ